MDTTPVHLRQNKEPREVVNDRAYVVGLDTVNTYTGEQ
jgi:hypothetical protein